MAILQTVEIPGYAEAVRRESRLRDTAFLDGLEMVCNEEVRPLCLQTLIWLEQARNGFVIPCKFDDDAEMLAHAVELLYFSTPGFKPPATPRFRFWRAFIDGAREQVFMRRVLRSNEPQEVVSGVSEWIQDAFMDAPAGGGKNEVRAPTYASHPAYIVDKFAAAGLPFTYNEILNMPLRRLWQHWRLAVKRLHDMPISNPSDELAVDYLAKVKT